MIKSPILILAVLLAGCGSATGPGGKASKDSSDIKTVVLGKPGVAEQGKAAPAMPGVNVPAIKVDTVGYRPDWKKIAVFNVEPAGAVVEDLSGKTVLSIAEGMIDARGVDEASKDPVWQVDFSALEKPGKYKIRVGEFISDPFEIGDSVYKKPLTAGLKSFYFQRTRTALKKPFAVWDGTAYTRDGVSHVHDDVGWDLEYYPEKKYKWKVEGGWHDAGNYDMYIPSTAPSAQTLLMAYEWAPGSFDDKSLNIPESGNGIPDILDEAKWGLVWILSLQEENGAFRHREAVMTWSPEVPADQDREVRWIAGISTSATAKAVAVLAVASRVYSKWDSAFASRCEKAAKKGFEFLKRTPEHIRADGKGGKQPLWDDEPGYTDVGARFIAAVEMWRQFRDQSALEMASGLMNVKETSDIAEMIKGAWANLSRWGLATLAQDDQTPAELRGEAKNRLLAAADMMIGQVRETDGYRCATPVGEYYWGHNSNLMEKAHILAVAYKLKPERVDYLEAARDQWHWVLGRNPNGYSMVTRVGKGPERMYHMEWGPKEPPPPGFLLGGPNAENMGFLSPDAPAKALLWDNPEKLRSGLEPHSLWHWRQSDLWDGNFLPEEDWSEGWWAVSETDILYCANFVLVAVSVE